MEGPDRDAAERLGAPAPEAGLRPSPREHIGALLGYILVPRGRERDDAPDRDPAVVARETAAEVPVGLDRGRLLGDRAEEHALARTLLGGGGERQQQEQRGGGFSHTHR